MRNWWRRGELNPRPKTVAAWLYMLVSPIDLAEGLSGDFLDDQLQQRIREFVLSFLQQTLRLPLLMNASFGNFGGSCLLT